MLLLLFLLPLGLHLDHLLLPGELNLLLEHRQHQLETRIQEMEFEEQGNQAEHSQACFAESLTAISRAALQKESGRLRARVQELENLLVLKQDLHEVEIADCRSLLSAV